LLDACRACKMGRIRSPFFPHGKAPANEIDALLA
jgi:hypothetical protein